MPLTPNVAVPGRACIQQIIPLGAYAEKGICTSGFPVQSAGVGGEANTNSAARMHELANVMAQPPELQHGENITITGKVGTYVRRKPILGRMFASNKQGSDTIWSELRWQVARVLTCRVQTRRVNTVVQPFPVRGAGRGLP